MSEPTSFDRLFSAWEKRTSEYAEKILSNPAFLNVTGGLLNSGFKNKIYVDKALMAFWKNLLLPNKRDQERTLHLLNELHSRLHDLEERMADMNSKNEASTPAQPPRRSPSTKTARGTVGQE